MKVAIVYAIVAVLACLEISEAGFVRPSVSLQKLRFDEVVTAGKPCKCMSRQACNGGEVNSDIQCHPSYAFVCCVIPEPETVIAPVVEVEEVVEEETGKPCKCMSRQACNGGEVNSDIQCHPSYAFVCCVIPETKTVVAPVVVKEVAVVENFGKPCKCMSRQACNGGEVNSDIQCHPSYAFVCCVIPEPETVIAPVVAVQEVAVAENYGKPCKCMSRQACNGGEVNSDIQCHPSYAFVCCVIPEVKTVVAPVVPVKEVAVVENYGKPCKCMSRQACNGGEVNSDIQCHPSYAFVCCVIPEPETVIAPVVVVQEVSEEETGKPCKCMSRQACNGGEVNSDIQCHPSYAFVCCVIPETKTVVAPVVPVKEVAVVENYGKPCKCMSRQACNGGEVNSDIQCHPSYAFVCCVIPDPEFNILEKMFRRLRN